MNTFCHLHVHSHYSLLDGLASPIELADRAVELGQPAIAITDHGNMYGAIDFYTTCRERGIKPIIGLETYVAPNSRFDKAAKKGEITAHHLTLLAKDNVGYHNLLHLSTKGFTEGFYYKPRIDLELLRLHHKGIICLSGCIYSKISRIILNVEQIGVEYILGCMKELIDIFGDDYYIEVQDHGIPEQKQYREYLLNNFPQRNFNGIVATNDVHYINKEDAEAHDALLCIGTGTNIYDKKRIRFPTDQLYLKSRQEMEQIFPVIWLDNTVKIAKQCNVDIKLHRKMHIHIPELAFQQLKEECDVRIVQNTPNTLEYQSRYEKELAAIQKTGYAEYLLVVADFIRYAKCNNIPVGSGRGSSAGSLVCFLLDITEIDPIPYGLLFERFINTERVEAPDIDVDISQTRRGEIVEYLKNEYGHDRVAQIIAFGSMKTKAVIKDVCRVLQLQYGIGDKICKTLYDPYQGSIDDVFSSNNTNPRITTGMDKETAKKLHNIARKIENKLRHPSTHAAGIVISDEPLINSVPLCVRNKAILTQYDMYSIEKLGLLKFDILGLRTLDVIDEACQYASIKYRKIPLNDTYTYIQLRRGNTFGIFQYEGYGYTKFIKRMQPQNFEHLIALGALYRPGTLDSGMADIYIDRMHGKTHTHDEITKDTYGILLYQEQVMQAVVKYAGFSMNKADHLRKAIGKKDKKLMEIMMSEVYRGITEQGGTPEKANIFIDNITTFARYGWNKAHAVSYALLSYYTAFLKYHYPTEFFCALLNSEINDNERMHKIRGEAAHEGVKILNPHINISTTKFVLKNGIIYGGLLAIKGIGARACEIVLEERKNGQYKDAQDLRNRIPPKQLNSLAMKALIDGGVFNA